MEPLLRQSDAGRAVFLTTGLARRPQPFFTAYGPSKAALENLVTTWADEIAHTPVRTVLLSPGPMRTRMRAQAFPGEDPETLPPPEAIVPTVLDLVRPDVEPPAYVAFQKTAET
jgi:NAD(P)-dependent dehydrogenase (short-subunit alcohol dehydrogenase family)